MSWHYAKRLEGSFCEIVEILDDIVFRTGDNLQYRYSDFYWIDTEELEVPLI